MVAAADAAAVAAAQAAPPPAAAAAQCTTTCADLITPACDRLAYRCVVLPNRLRVLLVSDPETEKAACAMNVSERGVGWGGVDRCATAEQLRCRSRKRVGGEVALPVSAPRLYVCEVVSEGRCAWPALAPLPGALCNSLVAAPPASHLLRASPRRRDTHVTSVLLLVPWTHALPHFLGPCRQPE